MSETPLTRSADEAAEIDTPDFRRRVDALAATDNVSNWLYLLREYLFLLAAVGLPIAFYEYRAEAGLAWAWNIPVTMLAVVVIGACQHRLATLAHEASHYMLFRNRLLNELISDWFCMFPLLSSTHLYRLQHLAHHHYVNDPELDPDISQMQASGHWLNFPVSPGRFVWMCVIKQILWWPSLVRYIHIRARYSVTGEGDGPYLSPPPQSQLLLRIGVLFLAGLVVVLTLLVQADKPWLLGVIPVGMLAAIVGFYMVVPERFFRGTLIAPIVPLRWMAIMRIGFLSILFVALAWLTYLTGKPWGLYYVVLWIVPLLTMFPFFMILRQVVQHGNAGNDRLGNTRIFFVGRLIQLAVFPIGMDYHLPHHLFPMVPHFRLQALHALLLNTAAYRRQATVVEGYFFHRGVRASGLTVLDLMARERI